MPVAMKVTFIFIDSATVHSNRPLTQLLPKDAHLPHQSIVNTDIQLHFISPHFSVG
jgi:hypothetical protein